MALVPAGTLLFGAASNCPMPVGALVQSVNWRKPSLPAFSLSMIFSLSCSTVSDPADCARTGMGRSATRAKSEATMGRFMPRRLGVRFGLWKTNDALLWLELAAFLHQLNAFEALEDVSLGGDGAFAFQAGMQ